MKRKNLLPSLRASKKQEADHPFYSLQREINKLFDNFFYDLDKASGGWYEGGWGTFSPAVDMRDNEKEFVIKAELPGVDEKDVEVTVTGDTVTIRGEKKEEKENQDKNYYYMERNYGSFHRVIPLPTEADPDKAEARFKNGVMEIRIPKNQASQAKGIKIPIKSG